MHFLPQIENQSFLPGDLISSTGKRNVKTAVCALGMLIAIKVFNVLGIFSRQCYEIFSTRNYIMSLYWYFQFNARIIGFLLNLFCITSISPFFYSEMLDLMKIGNNRIRVLEKVALLFHKQQKNNTNTISNNMITENS